MGKGKEKREKAVRRNEFISGVKKRTLNEKELMWIERKRMRSWYAFNRCSLVATILPKDLECSWMADHSKILDFMFWLRVLVDGTSSRNSKLRIFLSI
jgi:hypothetical protein